MKKVILLLILTVFCISTFSLSSVKYHNADSHINEYSEFTVSYHDNIDDEAHSHKHKHSEDGEEHEHNHEHSKVSQSEVKLSSHSVPMITDVSLKETKNGFREKNFLSTPHPFELFRPPII